MRLCRRSPELLSGSGNLFFPNAGKLQDGGDAKAPVGGVGQEVELIGASRIQSQGSGRRRLRRAVFAGDDGRRRVFVVGSTEEVLEVEGTEVADPDRVVSGGVVVERCEVDVLPDLFHGRLLVLGFYGVQRRRWEGWGRRRCEVEDDESVLFRPFGA
ncbi:hypothetical protein U1Q18_011524 [Sarracenia purpurea var. burkii]